MVLTASLEDPWDRINIATGLGASRYGVESKGAGEGEEVEDTTIPTVSAYPGASGASIEEEASVAAALELDCIAEPPLLNETPPLIGAALLFVAKAPEELIRWKGFADGREVRGAVERP